MNDSHPPESGTSTHHLSRTEVGRFSGAVSRVWGGVSSVQATGQFLRRQLWAWPIIAAVVFGGSGWLVNQSVEEAMRQQRAGDLNVMVDASVSALRAWMGEQQINAQLAADDSQVRASVVDLVRLAGGPPANAEQQLDHATSMDRLRQRLNRLIEICGYVGYFVVAPDGVVLAADQDALVGKTLDGYRKEVFDQGCAGKILVSRPYRSTLLLADEKGELRANLPTMFAIAPLLNDAGKPIAAVGLRIRPEDHFTRILQVVRFEETGETYAFDRQGLLLSQSRFDPQLKQMGLLADRPEERSILTVEVRDPQVDMSQGVRPKVSRAEQPLTRLAASAVQGKNGYDADGYRDYRGSLSVGAWRWLDDYDFGVGTEVDAAEAFRPVFILRRAFWGLMTLLILCAVGIFLAMLYISRQQNQLQRVTLEAKRLGQYTLEKKLGAGGMGTVYTARHAMLRRPTAVKLLDVDKISDAGIVRFEREVQLTSELTHPNTVAVYDYGRTPDGISYYAMEYLDGLNLDELIERFGPVSEARMVYILKQVCGALAEAHVRGLVHRDIKPANIFLTCRGGMHDFVKVLDFGLVKAIGGDEKGNITNPNAIIGTPFYLSPEAVTEPEKVDARADVYAVAAVGYYLITGTPVFRGASVVEICMKHSREIPEPPSVRSGKPVTADLEALLLRCLSKTPSDRPANAAELLRQLEVCAFAGIWTASDAAAWWKDYVSNEKSAESGTVKPPSQKGPSVSSVP